jgi:hypothetical protein
MEADLLSLDPAARQEMLAQLIRQRQLAAAQQQANQFGPLAAITQMANNPAAAQAAMLADKNQQARFKPHALGREGFMLPETGQFIPSPIYTQERKDERALKQSLAQAQIDARKEMEEQRAEDRRRWQETQAGFKQSQLQMQQEALSLRSALAAQAAQRQATPSAPKLRPLSKPAIDELTKRENVASQFLGLVSSFRPELAGTPGVAGLQNTLGKYQPLGIGSRYGNQSNWWQNYNEQKNAIRHTLFGSALTKVEKDAFEAATISEGMDPKMIAVRLQQQAAAAERAHNKLLANYGRGGFDVSQFVPLEERPAMAPGQSVSRIPMPQQPQLPPGLNLPPGAVYVGPAPR